MAAEHLTWGNVFIVIITAMIFYIVATWYDVFYTWYTYKYPVLNPEHRAPEIPVAPTPSRGGYQHKRDFAIVWTLIVIGVLLMAALVIRYNGINVGSSVKSSGHPVKDLDTMSSGRLPDLNTDLLRTVLPV